MEIKRNLSVDGTFSPKAVNFLGQVPDECLFFLEHKLRHPESIYSLSLERVGEAFTKVAQAFLAKMEEYQTSTSGPFEIQDLLKRQEDFLHALQEHLDDCYLILKTLVNPASASRSPIFADKYVVENRLPGARYFQEAMIDYKKTLRIVNKLKHQQGRLKGIAIWPGGGAHLGYILEEPDDLGNLSPSRDIHPDQGCISFSRDLAWHLFNVYVCSEKLVEAVGRALKALYRIDLSSKPGKHDSKWAVVVSLACKIPPALFPKEVKSHTATFRVSPDGQVLTIKFPERVKLVLPPQIKATFSTVGDGHSRSFKVPLP